MITISFWELFVVMLLAFAFAGWTLLAVLLGGWLVFRTKKEGHEPLFGGIIPVEGGVGVAKGDPLDDDDTGLAMGGDVNRILEAQNARFLAQQGKTQ